MSLEQEQFQNLRRLLALKRHEQPPPGYFNNFSRQVISRIQAGEHLRSESFAERYLWDLPLLRSLRAAFQAKPMLLGASGLASCALVLFGIVALQTPDSSRDTALGPAFAPVLAQTTDMAANPGAATLVSPDVSSLSGVPTFQQSDSLFERARAVNPLQLNSQPAAMEIRFLRP